MPPCGVLTLLTDFGLSDAYVAMMKGAIAQVNASLHVIDLTHQIPPQDIALARFTIMTAYPYFPTGTVHVAVVDPGVGSARRAIAIAVGTVAAPTGFLVGPDNGLFSGVLAVHPVIAAVELTKPQYWRIPSPSTTFHGRDIFAPVGAHLASGVPLLQMGERIAPETLMILDVPVYRYRQSEESGMTQKLVGCIQAIDHFGNLITNISGAQVLGKTWSLVVSNITIPGKETYSDSQPGDLLALVGSHGWVEIAVSSGSAQDKLNVDKGEPACLVEIVVSERQ